MPKMNGFELVREVGRRKINIEIVFQTMHSAEEVFQKAMDLPLNRIRFKVKKLMKNYPTSRKANIVVQELENEVLIYDLKLIRRFV